MKMHTVERMAQSEGSISSTKFGIVANAKMVSILSDRLYGNKIRAVIRELSTNAWDSHKEAGHEKPFDVHLPTLMEPFFYIRDYGVGMSDETFHDVYVQYGESTKDDSNEFTGCLGLGSKTPFCYNTKTATIIVWYNGDKKIYTLYPDGDGMPKADLVSQSNSDEPNGIQIMFSVDMDDCDDFEFEAGDIYKYFPVPPNFIGHKISCVKPASEFEGSNWRIVDSKSETVVIMGNIAYPINLKNIKTNNELQSYILTKGFEIYVNIGDVDIQPSREGLEYTNLTKIHLLRYVDNIIKEATSLAEDKIKNAKTLWDARCEIINLRGINKLFRLIDLQNVTWNSTPLGLNLFGNLDVSNHIVFHSDITLEDQIYFTKFVREKHKQRPNRIHSVLDISPTSRVYINDLKTGFIGRLNEEAQRSGDLYLLVIEPKADPVKVQALLDHLGTNKDVFIKTSTIPYTSNPNRSGSGVTKLSRVVELKHQYLYESKPSRHWKSASVDLNNGGVYVEFNRYEIKGTYSAKILDHLIKTFQSLGISIPTIYGIKSKDIPDLDTNWITIDEWMRDQYELLYITHGNALEQLTSYKNELNQYSQYANQMGIAEKYERLPIKDISDIIMDRKNTEKLTEKIDFYMKLKYISDTLAINKPAGNIIKLNLKSRLEAIHAKYPLLTGLSKSFIDQNLKVVKEYVSFIQQGVSNVSV